MHNQVKKQHESAPGRALVARSIPEDELRAAARDGSNVDAGRGSDRELGDGDVRWRRTCRGAAKDAGTWRSGGLPRRMQEEVDGRPRRR